MRLFSVDFNKEEVEEAPSIEVVRNKNIELKPMDVEEAILQMELLSHDFFIYADSEDHTTNAISTNVKMVITADRSQIE